VAIITCPGCGRSDLRVPDRRQGTVTCPGCGAKWFHPETVEFSEVEFRCSRSGARFTVISTRRSPLHKFVVQQITKAAPAAAPRPRSADKSPSMQPLGSAVVPSSRIAAPKVYGWLARITGRSVAAIPAPLAKSTPQNNTIPVAAYDANEYNWAGFACPYCDSSGFVHCRAGGHLACEGTTELRNGRRFHQCFCGGAGFITGTIETIGSNRLAVEVAPSAAKPPTPKSDGLTGKPAALPLPSRGKGGPPARQ
jgi:hypothetical protein